MAITATSEGLTAPLSSTRVSSLPSTAAGSGPEQPAGTGFEATRDALAAAGYLADDSASLVSHLAQRLGKPVLVEGPAGVGKTELAKALSRATGRPLIRLQCYEGLDISQAAYEWNYARQLLKDLESLDDHGHPLDGSVAAATHAWTQPLPHTMPGHMAPGQTVPGQMYPGQTMPGQTMPGQTMPGQTFQGPAVSTTDGRTARRPLRAATPCEPRPPAASPATLPPSASSGWRSWPWSTARKSAARSWPKTA